MKRHACFHLRASLRCAFFFLAVLTGSSIAAESGATASSLPEKIAQRGPALEALRKGDLAKADELLLALPKGAPNSAPWRLEYAEHLMAAAIDLKNKDKFKLSTDYFHRAAEQLEAALAAPGAPSLARERSDIYHQLGFIARVADGDIRKANGYFKQALAADPTNNAATLALQRTKDGRKELDALPKSSGK